MGQAQRIGVVYARAQTRDAIVSACEDAGYECSAVRFDEEFQGPGLDLVVLEAPADQLQASIANLPLCPVLVVLAESGDDFAAASEAGAADCIRRPIAVGELLGRIQAQLAARPTGRAPVWRERGISLMLELTQALVASLDVEEILHTVVSRIAKVVRVDRVSIVLVPREENTGYVVATSDDADIANLRIDLDKYPEILHVRETGAPLTIGDVDTHPLLDGVRRSVTDAGLGALTLIPMLQAQRVIGVLFIRAATRNGAVSDRQLAFCQVLANATAIALRNARLMEDLRADSARDATARQEAERELRSLKHYAHLFASSADGLTAFDAKGQLLYANPGAYHILGYEESELRVGAPVFELLPPRSQRRAIALTRSFGRGEFPHDVDLEVQRPDGQVMTINGSFSPLSGTEGAVLLSFRDVTKARSDQHELERTRNFLQSLIDASVDAIVAADMSGKIILFNRGAQRLYGYTAAEAVGKMHVAALYPGDGAREVGRMLFSGGHGGEGRLEPVRMEAVDSRGNIFPITLTSAVIYQQGKATATFGIFTDLRERVRVEEQLAQAQEKLALSEKQALVAELAGATAHELNQPLTSVMAYTELLTRKMGDSPGAMAADVIHKEAERMAEIVRKIGRLTRYETKSYVGDQKILDLDRGSEDEDDDVPRERSS